jgi:outer membrane immunogenic protein
MKKLLLAMSAIVAFAVATPADAADLRMPAKAAPAYKPACANFGGWFVNGHVGWANYQHSWTDLDAWASSVDEDLPQFTQTSKSGFAGGVGVGYNWQPSCVLFGVDLDYDWASITASKFHTDECPCDDTVTVSSKLRGFGTLRVRTGLVVESLLLYVTGGLAWGSFDRSWTVTTCCNVAVLAETFSYSRTRLGGVVGVGAEWDWGGGWSIRAETLYMKFEPDTQTFSGSIIECCDPKTKRFESQDVLLATRIGLSYRFGGFGKYPVAARY